MAATLHGRTKVVQVLLQTGADRYIANKVGHTVSGRDALLYLAFKL